MSIKELVLTESIRKEIEKYNKPRAFLDTIGKNSIRTRNNYGTGTIHDTSSVDTEHDTVKVSSITNFFYDDPTIPYTPLPEHDLEQSPCFSIIAIKQGYFYCRLHPDVKNVHLESIEHHIKYKEPAVHQSELLRFSKLTHD